MTALHYVRVRRARGLAMPLPPEPKARPLGPPVLFSWSGVDIRVRADVERAGWTWDEFLDGLVAFRLDPDTMPSGMLALQAVESLVPPADLGAHRDDVRRRVLAQRSASLQRFKEARDAAYRASQEVQTKRTSLLSSRFFRRHA